MNTKVLCVDDDPRILTAYQRNLSDQFALDVAPSGAEALKRMTQDGAYAVVVADMQMPEMNGIELLMKVRERFPDTVRMMLTGNADQQTAVDAVNKGHIYRFINKPCPPDVLALALDAGVKQYHLLRTERELLEQTLNGSVKVLIDVLSMADPPAFGVGQKLRDHMRAFARSLKAEKAWELELGAMLSPIGYVTVPAVVLQKYRSGFSLSGPERDILDRVPEVGASLVANIPRLETVSRIVRYQAKHHDGSGFPADDVKGDEIPVGARILKVLSDMTQLEVKGTPRFKALEQMRARNGWYDPKVLDAAFVCFDIYLPDGPGAEKHRRAITLRELKIGHILAEPLETLDGVVVAGAGLEVTQMILEKVRNFARLSGIKEPLQVEA